MRGTVTYVARDGRVIAKTPEGEREVWSALSANGRDLERFQIALDQAKRQRETTNLV